MQYPGTIDVWYDQSSIAVPVISDEVLHPVFLTAFAGPKGPEKITRVSGEDFYKLYGYSLDSEKFGQALIQASQLINNGAELVCKRVVADNATLANAVICATVGSKVVQKTNARGQLIYIDNITGNETTLPTDANGLPNEKVNITAANIKYSVVHFDDCTSKVQVVAKAKSLYNDETKVFPLFVIVDNGRGVSTKRFSITADYTISKSLSYMLYSFNYLGTKTKDFETTKFAMVPGTVFGNNSMALSMVSNSLLQSEGVELDEYIELFYTEVANISGIGKTIVEEVTTVVVDEEEGEGETTTPTTSTTETGSGTDDSGDGGDGTSTAETGSGTDDSATPSTATTVTYDIDNSIVKGYDLLFGKTIKGESISGIIIDPESADLSASVGFALAGGSDGDFAVAKKSDLLGSSAYQTALLKFYNGTYDADIWNLDKYQIDGCLDANYPWAVKSAITELAKFRKDFVFFGDFTTNCTSYESAIDTYTSGDGKVVFDKFTAWYPQTINVIDPFSKKFINVTFTYLLASNIVDHFRNRDNAPFCGIKYGWTFPDAIVDTINFTPKITPYVNQKQDLGDMHLNYASILNDTLTLETTYTSQEADTQLSFIQNVTSIQAVVKDVRRNAPSFRYTFITTTDLESYKSQVTAIIERHKSKFDELEFVYVQDEIMAANKIFEADLKFRHKEFIQTELLNVYTLNTTTVSAVDDNI